MEPDLPRGRSRIPSPSSAPRSHGPAHRSPGSAPRPREEGGAGFGPTTVLLAIYSVAYLLPLFWVGSVRSAFLMLGGGIVLTFLGVFASLRMAARFASGKKDSGRTTRWVSLTSICEGVAVIAGVLLGLTAGKWWLLPLFLSIAVVLHFAALTWTLRRPVDFVVLPVACTAASVVWSLPLGQASENWALAGVLVSACCVIYTAVLTADLKQSKPTAARPNHH